MNACLLGAAGAGTEPVIGTSTALLLILVVVVGLLAKAVADLRREVERLRLTLRPEALPAPAPAAPGPTPAGAMSPELQAAISAAVVVALEGAPARIMEISAPVAAPGWSLEGRREVFGSHRIR